MKHLVIYVLICLSALFSFGNCSSICSSKSSNYETVIDSIDKKELLKENLKNDLTNEVSTYILDNSKNKDT